jgi:hypothetical protein
MRRQALGLVVAAALVASAGAGAAHKEEGLPFLRGFHFTGTPLRLDFYDGGGTVGPVGLMYEYNLKGIVPGSYAGVVTRCRDTVVHAKPDRQLEVDRDVFRMGWCQDFPDPYDYLDKILSPSEKAVSRQEEPSKTFYEDPATATVFYFFVNDATGALKLVSNPENFATRTLIPNAAAFQLSVPVFETYPVGANGHTSPDTKLPDLIQPALALKLVNLREDLSDARALTGQASTAIRTKKKYTVLLTKAQAKLKAAGQLAGAATASGELTPAEAAGVSGPVRAAHTSVARVLRPPKIYPNKPARQLSDLKAAGQQEAKALALIERVKALREVGK